MVANAFETTSHFIYHTEYFVILIVWYATVMKVVTHFNVLLTAESNHVLKMFLAYHHTHRTIHHMDHISLHFTNSNHHLSDLVYVGFNVDQIHGYTGRIYT